MDMPKIKIDVSQVKKVLGKLTFVRNYSSFILPFFLIVVVLVLLAANKVMSSGLKNKIQKESIQPGRSIQNYLPQEISSRQWRVEKQYQDSLEQDANAISELEKHNTQRELLSYDLFPEPKDTSALIFEQYGTKYRQGIEDLVKRYGARGCPTPMEIAKAVQQSHTGGSQVNDSRSYIGIGDVRQGSMDRAERMIVDELCLEAARKAKFYVEPYDIAGYQYWGMKRTGDATGEKVYQYLSIGQSVQDCWYWQLGYWIIEDVFKTIGTMNRQCDNVMDCPVKRLTEVSFVSDSEGLSVQEAALSEAPKYIGQDDEEANPVHTGHISNDKIDVVHFKIVAIIDPRAVLGFVEELCSAKEHTFRGWSGDQPPQKFMHNQITVLEVNINPVSIKKDRIKGTDDSHQLYRYGNRAVSEMELLCEYIFEKAGYDEIKPETIKEQIVQEDL